MLFSSVAFLYWFLPALLIVYFIVPKRAKNHVLLAASLIFYIWGEPKYAPLLLGMILTGYLTGLAIEKFSGTKKARVALVAGVAVSLTALGVFKYADFFISTLASVLKSDISPLRLALPIGISFYTFQLISYMIDVYRGNARAERNVLTLATYAALFPQLIAGPIVRYTDVSAALVSREHTAEGFASGAFRFAVGLSKKLLIADRLAELSTEFGSLNGGTLGAWLYAVAFALHLYFDFSAYSDMAIGLGRIFGFTFPENFNYPFISKSVTEFWRRWHMTLGSFFRDYVYIPLGGNRVKTPRWIFNVLVVWALTGLWHGAGWNFVVWGLAYAALLAIEKLFLGKLLDKLPAFLRYVYTLLITVLVFIIFDSESLTLAFARMGGLFGAQGYGADAVSIYRALSYLPLMLVACIGATPLVKRTAEKVFQTKAGAWLRLAALLVMMLACTAYLVDGTFSPFIYFRF